MGRIRDTWEDWDANRKLIAISAIGIAVLIVWAGIARVDEVTRGMGKVIPSSKVQLGLGLNRTRRLWLRRGGRQPCSWLQACRSALRSVASP